MDGLKLIFWINWRIFWLVDPVRTARPEFGRSISPEFRQGFSCPEPANGTDCPAGQQRQESQGTGHLGARSAITQSVAGSWGHVFSVAQSKPTGSFPSDVRSSAQPPPQTGLQAEAASLEDVLKNQAHPKNLVAVKKSGTPVLATPSITGKTLFMASAHDEFEMLDFNADWVHVRISGLSRGWSGAPVWRCRRAFRTFRW